MLGGSVNRHTHTRHTDVPYNMLWTTETLTPMCLIFFVKVYKSARISITSLETFLFKLRKHHFRLVSFFVCSEQHPIRAFCVRCVLCVEEELLNLCLTCDFSRTYQCILVTSNSVQSRKLDPVHQAKSCFLSLEYFISKTLSSALIIHHGEM